MESNGINTSYQTNGCGACQGFWKFIKPPHRNFFKDECNIHDVEYEIGGNSYDRKLADINLKYNMKLKIYRYFYRRKIISRIWYLIIANIYFFFLRLFGFSNFNYKK